MAKHCYFCSQNIFHIDYKNTDLIRRFLTSQAKILTPQRTDNCATHQRMLARATKRARYLALLPFTNR